MNVLQSDSTTQSNHLKYFQRSLPLIWHSATFDHDRESGTTLWKKWMHVFKNDPWFRNNSEVCKLKTSTKAFSLAKAKQSYHNDLLISHAWGNKHRMSQKYKQMDPTCLKKLKHMYYKYKNSGCPSKRKQDKNHDVICGVIFLPRSVLKFMPGQSVCCQVTWEIRPTQQQVAL